MNIYQENIYNTSKSMIHLENTDNGYKMIDHDGDKNIICIIEKDTYSNVIKIASGIKCDITKEGYNKGFTIKDNYIISADIFKSQIEQKLILLNHNTIPYDLYSDAITNDMLDDIYNNIYYLTDIVKEFKNVLFICGDYPGYGGAATNCDRLQTHFTQYCNTYAVYYNYENDNHKESTGESTGESTNNYIITNQNTLYNTLKNLNFKPDLVILKSVIHINENIRDIYKCPIFFFIPGIYNNCLKKYYFNIKTKEDSDRYINKGMLDQIKNSDFSFSNSSHTQKILKDIYGVDTSLFYSTFISYYKLKLEPYINWDTRQYNYGLIMSNFKRPIKNINKSINFLKTKKNVILIGQNSSEYEKYGFECIEQVDNNEMANYMKQIKYIVQNSFYESCSNVKVEGFFNGCLIYNIRIIISSTQYPGYGGAATNAYNLIKYFRKEGYNTCGVFFHNNLKVNYNPDNIKGIYLYHCKYNINLIRDETSNYLNGLPNLCLAKNYMAPIYCKDIFKCYTIYLVSGINHFNKYYPSVSSQELMENTFNINNIIEEEVNCNKLVDKIVINSNLTKDIFCKIYPEFKSKVYDNIIDTTITSNMILYNTQTIKKYDIIIICSNLERIDKNNFFLIKILNDDSLKKYTKCVIGNNNTKFKDIDNITLFYLLPNQECLELMSKSKLLLFPSKFDANPNTIREAYNNKCLPLITKNIGFYELYPDNLVCNSFDETEWITKIKYNLENYDSIKNTQINFKDKMHVSDFIQIYNSHINYNHNKQIKSNILLVSSDLPYIGGCGTNSYNIIKHLLKINRYNIIGLFITNIEGELNPNQFNDIYKINITPNIIDDLEIFKKKILYKYNTIDLILIKNYKSYIFIDQIFHDIKKIFISSGLRYFTNNIEEKNITTEELIKKKFSPLNYEFDIDLLQNNTYDNILKYDLFLEKYVYINANKIISNSDITTRILKLANLNNITTINTTFIEYKNINTIPFNERIYDIVFIAYNLNRKLKNYDLLYRIISSNKIDNLKIIIIGLNNDIIKVNKKNIIYKGYLDNTLVNNILSNTKCYLCLSLYDSSPNTIVEAMINKCNIITSHNIGNINYLNKDLIITNYYDINEWIEKIKLSTNEEYKYRIHDNISDNILTELITEIDTLLFEDTLTLVYNCSNNGEKFIKQLFSYDYTKINPMNIDDNRNMLPKIDIINSQNINCNKTSKYCSFHSCCDCCCCNCTCSQKKCTNKKYYTENEWMIYKQKCSSHNNILHNGCLTCNQIKNINKKYLNLNLIESQLIDISYDSSINLKNNMYVDICYNIAKQKKLNVINYIIYDGASGNPEIYSKSKYNSILINHIRINIFILHNPTDIIRFRHSRLTLLRGLYESMHLLFKNKTIFYPASCLELIETTYNNPIILQNYSYILYHTNREKIYYKSKLIDEYRLIQFNKYNIININDIPNERMYDIGFIANGKGMTKNIKLFTKLIDYILSINNSIKIIIVCDNTIFDKYNCNNIFIMKNNEFNSININDIYIKTRINIILSLWDYNPRILSESLSFGCYNIIFKQIYSGSYIIDENNKFGYIIDLHTYNIINYNNIEIEEELYLKFIPIWERIINIILFKKIDHNLISEQFNRLYNKYSECNNIINKIL